MRNMDAFLETVGPNPKFKVSRIQSISLNQNKFQNNSGGKIQRGLQCKLVDTYEKIQVANK
jgi:hypothetical protein